MCRTGKSREFWHDLNVNILKEFYNSTGPTALINNISCACWSGSVIIQFTHHACDFEAPWSCMLSFLFHPVGVMITNHLNPTWIGDNLMNNIVQDCSVVQPFLASLFELMRQLSRDSNWPIVWRYANNSLAFVLIYRRWFII